MNTDQKGILEEKCGPYNPKIDYAFARNFNQSANASDVNEYDYRKVYYGEKEPFDARSRDMLLAKRCLTLIAQSSDFSLELEQSLFSAIQGEDMPLSTEQITVIAKAEPSMDEPTFDRPFLYFLALANQKCLGRYRFYFAAVLCLAKLAYQGLHPFVFYPKQVEKALEIEKTNPFAALQDVECLYYAAEMCCQTHPFLTLEDIKPQLLSLQDGLAKQYAIQGLWVFGSFARKETTIYSDLDVYLKASRVLSAEEKGEVFALISSATGLRSDGEIENAALDEASDLSRAVKESNVQIF
jgi:predicted nucleotidyltransferase